MIAKGSCPAASAARFRISTGSGAVWLATKRRLPSFRRARASSAVSMRIPIDASVEVKSQAGKVEARQPRRPRLARADWQCRGQRPGRDDLPRLNGLEQLLISQDTHQVQRGHEWTIEHVRAAATRLLPDIVRE